MIHEAFFDPAAIGSGVGADGSNGTLHPAAFAVGGSVASLKSLKWQDGYATLILDPYVSLSGLQLDIIALDGSVALTLSADSAATDAAKGTLTWTLPSQPWSAGDQLMLRIREATSVVAPMPMPTQAPTPAPTPDIQTAYFYPTSDTLLTGYAVRTGDCGGTFWGCLGETEPSSASQPSSMLSSSFMLS